MVSERVIDAEIPDSVKEIASGSLVTPPALASLSAWRMKKMSMKLSSLIN